MVWYWWPGMMLVQLAECLQRVRECHRGGDIERVRLACTTGVFDSGIPTG